MNDEIYPGREVMKVHTSRTNAFLAPGAGPLGVTDPDAIVLHRERGGRDCAVPAFDLSEVGELPRVDVVYTALGTDGTLVRAATEAGARGIVVAGVGRGGTTPAQREALAEAREQGLVVVLSSRTGAGRVPVERSGDDAHGLLGAGDLNPQ